MCACGCRHGFLMVLMLLDVDMSEEGSKTASLRLRVSTALALLRSLSMSPAAVSLSVVLTNRGEIFSLCPKDNKPLLERGNCWFSILSLLVACRSLLLNNAALVPFQGVQQLLGTSAFGVYCN